MWLIFALVLCQAVEGDFRNHQPSSYGIIVTDSRFSALYLLKGSSIEKLFAHPGCGRYYTISPNRRQVGFKLIKENGEQIPAICDIETGSITHLSEPVFRAGQPSFSDDGKIGFTIGEDLIIKSGVEKEVHHLDCYANLCPISPDGRFAVFNDERDQLWVLSLENGIRYCFTDSESGYCYPVWSPNSRFIAFSTLDGLLLVYDLFSKGIYRIGQGSSPDWSHDSRFLVYHKTITDGHRLLNSELCLSRYDGSESFELTDTRERMEMEPRFGGADGIIFRMHTDGAIYGGKIAGRQLKEIKKVHKLAGPLEIDYFYPMSDFGARDSINVPYLNQVYDTPDWHNGHWSCAPTTAMMAIAYYRRLPYWDCWCSTPYGHTSHFGNYICSIYHYREVSYDLIAQDAGGNNAWGGYGYMWYNGYSPYSRMMNYLQYHDITSWADNSPTWEETVAEVQAGWPYCMCVGLTAAGHLILAVGQVLDWHTLIFNDPYGNKNTPGYPSYDGKYARYDWPGYNNGYENLNQVHWCRGSRGDWLPECDTIVDDLQYQYTGESYGFYMFNSAPSTQRYFHDNLTGYGGHMWWTYTTAAADTCYVTWTPHLAQAGDYEVFAYIPDVNANGNARYQIHYDGGTQTAVIDQSSYSNYWVSLGIYPFALSGGYVYLGDATGTSGQHIGFDAIRWSLVSQVAEENGTIAMDQIRVGSTLITKDLVLFVSHRDLAKMSISVLDISGRPVLEDWKILNSGDQRIIIDASQLPSGVYFLKTSLAGYGYTRKFIKLR
jgi:hypothetical protein